MGQSKSLTRRSGKRQRQSFPGAEGSNAIGIFPEYIQDMGSVSAGLLAAVGERYTR
jgi:hypothetical protein